MKNKSNKGVRKMPDESDFILAFFNELRDKKIEFPTYCARNAKVSYFEDNASCKRTKQYPFFPFAGGRRLERKQNAAERRIPPIKRPQEFL